VAQGASAYHNPFDLAAQSQSYAEQTNPQALMAAFGTQDPYKNPINIQNITAGAAAGNPHNRQENEASAAGGQPGRKKWSARPQGQQEDGPQHHQREQIEMDNDDDEYKEEEVLPEPETQQVVKRNRFSNAQHGAAVVGIGGRRSNNKSDDDEDSYSDDDFEVQVDGAAVQENVRGHVKAEEKSLQVIQEFTNESRDQEYSAIQDQYDDQEDIVDATATGKRDPEQQQDQSSAHIEMFLKTATAQEMDIIRESLSNF